MPDFLQHKILEIDDSNVTDDMIYDIHIYERTREIDNKKHTSLDWCIRNNAYLHFPFIRQNRFKQKTSFIFGGMWKREKEQ